MLLTSPCIYGAIIINTLAKHTSVDLVGLGLTNRVYKNKGLLGTVSTAIKRMGWRYTIYNALVGDVACSRLRLSKRPTGLTAVRPTNTWLIDDINSQDTIAQVQSVKPDFIVSFYFNQWIGESIRSVAAKDCLNVHPSLLPQFRGPDPAFWMLERGHQAGGITVHRVADEFDAGEIIAQRPLHVDLAKSVFELYCDWAEAGAEFLCESLSSFRDPNVTASIAPIDDGYNTFPTAQEVRAFINKGGRLISLRELRRRLSDVQ